MPLIGNKFPEMEVITSQGKKKLPKDFRRQWVIFFSHTADFTPVCTTEIVSFA
ncbi:MAG: redoxin domain-containing protein, partial [Candidatus Thorarchaeota archaeon]